MLPCNMNHTQERGVGVAADEQGKKRSKEDKQKEILDFTEAWKKMYFDTETTLAKAVDEYVAGDSFTAFLEKMGAEYLSIYKTHNQNMERFFANSPVPTKKDVARIAELVINIEEKVDNLDMEVLAGLNSLAANIMRLVEFQAVMKDEIISLHKDVQAVQKQLQALQPAAATDKPVRTRSKKATVADAVAVGENDDISSNAEENADKTPRPRSRRKT